MESEQKLWDSIIDLRRSFNQLKESLKSDIKELTDRLGLLEKQQEPSSIRDASDQLFKIKGFEEVLNGHMENIDEDYKSKKRSINLYAINELKTLQHAKWGSSKF